LEFCIPFHLRIQAFSYSYRSLLASLYRLKFLIYCFSSALTLRFSF
jgi:hypothetical protein